MNKEAVKWLYQQLPELVSRGVLSPVDAERLKKHYGPPEEATGRKTLLLVFGIVGVLLVGLGVILILAHNWPQFSRTARLAISVGLLAAAQAAAGMVLLYRRDSRVWRESAATLQCLMIGAAMALVSQTYHLTGDTAMFLRTWLLLTLPVIYFMKSSFTAGLYITGVAVWTSGAYYSPDQPLAWLLLLLALPYYLRLIQTDRFANATVILSWVLNLSFLFCFMTTLGNHFDESAFLIYSLLFSVQFLLGALWFNSGRERWQMPFQTIGLAGIAVLSYMLTFNGIWRYMHWDIAAAGLTESLVMLSLLALSAGGNIVLARRANWDKLQFSIAPLIIGGAYLLQLYQNSGFAATVLLNCYLLVLSIRMITAGVRRSSLSALNSGMLLLALLIVARFLDINFSFVIRGVVFVLLGISFLTANWVMVRRKKSEETI